MGRGLILAIGGGLAAAACHFVVDQPASPTPYPYSYPQPPQPAASYRSRSTPSSPAEPYAAASPAQSYSPAPNAAPSSSPMPPAPEEEPAGRPFARTSYPDEERSRPPRSVYSAPGCLDSAPAEMPDCALIRRAPARCDLDVAPRQRCSGYRAYFDPKVAASAISCLSSLTGRQLCESSRTIDCAKIALAEACLDPSVEQLCQIAQKPCKTTASACAASLSGLNDQGQQIVAECVARGCETGLDGCLDALTSGR